MAKSALELIQASLRGRTVLNAPMAGLTTIRVGGPADLLLYPADREELSRLLVFLAEREIPWVVLGNGSNLIVRDGGVRGAVLCLSEGFAGVELGPKDQGKPTIRVGAGVPLQRFVGCAAEQGIRGFESLTGIPGTLGGAIAMNAGAWGFEIGERVLEVQTMGPAGEAHTLQGEALRFGYRSFELPTGDVLLGAVLRGEPGEPTSIRSRMREMLERRRQNQPLGHPSAGSVFKNPPGLSAGRLIDDCGLKGARMGDAVVSRVHANFIVNEGAATAEQVLALMSMVQERVFVRHGIRLEPEVRIMGDDEGKHRIRG